MPNLVVSAPEPSARSLRSDEAAPLDAVQCERESGISMTTARKHTPEEIRGVIGSLTGELTDSRPTSSIQTNTSETISSTSDSLGLSQGTAPFRPQARLIRLLGEQLISDESTAILELIKNAYDADARRVEITFQAPSSDSPTVLEIQDDGDGMDLQTLLTGWLEPATHRKRGGRWKQRTVLGRFPLGEKGVGRFAADKLGSHFELVTRPRGGAEEIVLQIQWSLFESDVYLDEIKNHWKVRTPEVFLDGSHGALIRITDLRFQWDARFIQRIRDSLTRLISPNARTDDFTLVLSCSNLPELSGPITNRFLDQSPYQLQGKVDVSGRLHLEGDGWKTRVVDLRTKAREAFLDQDGKLRAPRCGSFSLALHAWDLDAIAQTAVKVDRGTRQTLKQWCGVSIYRDGFRVLPYGERGDDWLELNQRRVNNPTLRLSNNQLIGIIETTQHDNPDLRDRTSREGMIDNPEFDDFRQLVLAALSCLEEQRFALRHEPSERKAAVSPDPDPVIGMLQLLTEARGESGSKSVLAELERTYRAKEEQQKRREASLLQLAGLGMAAERLAPTLAATAAAATDALRIMRHRLAVSVVDDQTLSSAAIRLEGMLESIVDHLDVMTPLRSNLPKGIEPVDLRAVVTDVCQIMLHQTRSIGARVQVTEYKPPIIQAEYGHIVQIMLVLFDNALYWLNHAPSGVRPMIRVHLWSKGSRGGFVVADNGPGISPSQAQLIFEPFYSTRREGLGLGLFTARQLASRYDGKVELRDRDRFLAGANVAVNFSLL